MTTELLRTAGAHPCAQNWGTTPLHLAVSQHNCSLTLSMFETSHWVSVQDISGKAALHIALEKSQPREIIQAIVSKTLDHDIKDVRERVPLHLAVCSSNPINVKVLLDAGANPSVVDNCGRTPLHLAAENNNLEAAKLLQEAGAMTSIQARNGDTPLQETHNTINQNFYV
jgi:ankyrin repeat protein